MLYYTAAMWLAAIVLLAAQPKQATNRWAAFFLFGAGLGGLAELVVPAGWIPATYGPLIQILNHTLSPYGVLIFALVYSGVHLAPARARTLKLLLALPPIASGIAAMASADHRIDYALLLAWTAPYYVIACYLLIRAYLREANPQRRKNRLITAVIMVPTLMGVMLLINVGNLLFPGYDFFRYVSLLIVYSFGVGLICAFVYGVLGLRFKVERDPLENAMQAVTTGTALLNHSIKNEVGKIALSLDNAKRMLETDPSGVHAQLEIMAQASEHLLAMTERIQRHTKELKLEERPVRLDRLVEGLAEREREQLHAAGIELRLHVRERPWLLADPVHLAEAAGNVLRNAAEAMPDGGVIAITVSAGRQGAAVAVRDQGGGIPLECQGKVFEPFYSTKKERRHNFGLGLSYVYNVMKKSGGSVGLVSRVGEGTEVTLYFPRRAVIRLARREEA